VRLVCQSAKIVLQRQFPFRKIEFADFFFRLPREIHKVHLHPHMTRIVFVEWVSSRGSGGGKRMRKKNFTIAQWCIIFARTLAV
jgi:hypothetical protein